MDYLQYGKGKRNGHNHWYCFKPYYKWITFNTRLKSLAISYGLKVLNLIINGLPSILQGASHIIFSALMF